MENALKEGTRMDYMLALLPFLAELTADTVESDRVIKLRLSAFGQLRSQLEKYKQHGYMESLLFAIAKKKGNMIMRVTSKAEMERLMNPRAPHYDGNRFVPDAYHIPEEELIAWSETSFLGPLNDVGFRRYKELFIQVFPERAEEIFGGIHR